MNSLAHRILDLEICGFKIVEVVPAHYARFAVTNGGLNLYGPHKGGYV